MVVAVGETKWSPGSDLTGPEGSQCFQGDPLGKNVKNYDKKLMSWVISRISFQSMTKNLVKLSIVIVRMSCGLFALSLCFCLGGTN